MNIIQKLHEIKWQKSISKFNPFRSDYKIHYYGNRFGAKARVLEFTCHCEVYYPRKDDQWYLIESQEFANIIDAKMYVNQMKHLILYFKVY